MKKKFDVFLLRMTLLKFVLFSMICWFILYAVYQYAVTSLALKIIIGCSIAIIFMNGIRVVFDNAPRLYFLLYSLGLVPTIVFIEYSLFLILQFEGNPQYGFIIGVYSIAVLFIILIVQDKKVKERNIRSRVISIYTVKKDNDLIGDKVIDAYNEINEPSEKTSKIISKIERLTPFIPAFNVLFVKHFHSFVGLVLITCLMMLLLAPITEFGRNAYNFVHLFSTLRKMEE
ncbi:MAG: hypothetical protein K8R77_15240 [Anaerolineaceae bacterium]|nr:hypothetical protein [Anaerolineaceae bacterium]